MHQRDFTSIRRFVWRASLIALGFIAICVGDLGCQNKFVASVGGALLAECDGVVTPAPGPLYVVKSTSEEAQMPLPAGPVIQLAVDRAVSWRRMTALLARVKAAHAQPVLLVGVRDAVRAFEPNDVLTGGPSIELVATPDGKFCMRPPGATEAYCVKGTSGHIQRDFVRETLRDAVKAYGLYEVAVYVDRVGRCGAHHRRRADLL